MSRLSMWFLGGYQVRLDGEPVTTLKYDKARALLAYLAMEVDRPHRRETLAGLLWPDLTERQARRNLSQALLTLRHALGVASPLPFLMITPSTIQFNSVSDHWTDVSKFTSLLGACKAHSHWRLETCGACGRLLERASALYGGPFLQGLSVADCPAFEEWQVVWRERLHHEATDGLRALAISCDHRGERDAALRYAEQWVAADPWHEGARRTLMRALAQNGRRAEALAQYEICRRTLNEELGVDPTQNTVALYEAIRDGAALPELFPPLPNNLPAPATPFLGREGLLDELTRLLLDRACRLVTLVGPGGIGKTRLAVQVGAQVVDGAPSDLFPDGVYMVRLASIRTGDSIAPAVARALGYGFAPGEEPEGSLLRALRQKRILLILDNYEQLLDGSFGGRLCGAGAVAEILGAAPGVQILVTSRARLNVLAERVLIVGGMAFPPDRDDGEAVTRYDAVALFLDRARAVQPTFAPLDGELGQVSRICRLVEGMPLAILLAASWADVLPPCEIADQLGLGIDLLETDLRDLPPRQRSMRAVFDASWELLTSAERDAFGRLSVFRGGFTSEAAQAVAQADLGTLRGLVRKSFLQVEPSGRYQVHELLRQCGSEKLAQSPKATGDARDRHSAYYAAALERWAAALKGPRQEEAWSEMAIEMDNVRAAWDWAAERGYLDQLDRAMEGLGMLCTRIGPVRDAASHFERAAAALEPVTSGEDLLMLAKLWGWQNYFARARGTRGELTDRCLSLLDHPEFAAPHARRDRATVLLLVGETISDQDTRRGRELCLRSLALYRELDDRWEIGRAQEVLGVIAWLLGDYDEAERRFGEALAIARSLDEPVQTLHTISWLVRVAYMRGQEEECAHWACEYTVLSRGLRDPGLVASGINAQALASIVAGQFPAGDAFYDACKAIYWERGYHIVSARMDAWQSTVKIHLGLYEEARSLAQIGLKAGRQTGTPEEVGLGLCALGCVALVEGSYRLAQRQLQESVATFRGYGARAQAGQVLATLGCAAYYVDQRSQARRHLCETLRISVKVGSTLPALHALPTIALILAVEGGAERAIELYALACRYPYVANSCWFEDLVGKHVAATAGSLPPDVVAAAQERGRARDLEATLAELLEELEPKHDRLK